MRKAQVAAEGSCGIRLLGNAATLSLRFCADERGTTAVVFALVFTIILLAAGMAIDISRSASEQARVQRALDASVLAASTKLGQPNQAADGLAVANKFLAQNVPAGSPAAIQSLQFNTTDGSVTGTISSYVPMGIMNVFGKEQINVTANSTVKKGNGTIEVALVLDNSGSMRDDMPTLRSAATSMTNTMFGGEDGTGKVKVAIVPFSSAVRVGGSYRNASWIDGGGASSIHYENFNVAAATQTYTEARNVSKTRFQLFDDLNVAWNGCVESRPGALDTNDTEPTAGNGNSLFVPMFAPDEPDDSNATAAGYSNYPNDYIPDTGGTCTPPPPPVCIQWNRSGTRCIQYSSPPPIDVASAQARTCKYSGATFSGDGPNHRCPGTLQPLQDLSANKTTVTNKIAALDDGGGTNIGEGLMWGWRVLSPGLPFTLGKTYNDSQNKKIIIVMTDGQNTLNDESNHNLSQYSASGYASRGRVGTTYTNAGYTSAMDAKLTAACTNAKAAGITIFAVAFRLDTDVATQALLRSCASSSSNYYAASDTAALTQSFQSIGRNIAELRLAN